MRAFFEKAEEISEPNLCLKLCHSGLNERNYFRLLIDRSRLKAFEEVAYEQFSWWNKLKYAGEEPDLSEMDSVINKLETIQCQLAHKHEDDYKAVDAYLNRLKVRSATRISKAKLKIEELISNLNHQESIESSLLNKAIWFSALSLPVSMWSDLDQAGEIYDVLRSVSGNFVNMSDSEIWWETLFMSSESMAGLASLTKGAYLEQLVAADTGGQLFEHFNNPDTDIVIDGVAYQIKATESAFYVESVADGIPVIATSEVAAHSGVIDAGFSNEELTNTVDLALGGSVVDVGDSAVDAVLAGLGGLGVMATLEGINHAVKKHENGGDGVEALFEGAGLAIEGTARALVGAAELGYKAITSRPSRFVGRQLLKGLQKIDDKLMGEVGDR